jgi:hypothetical protein
MAKIPIVSEAYIVKKPLVVATISSGGFTGVGVAQCMKGDYFSEEIGKNIAFARAVKDFSSKVEEVWVGRSATEAEVKSRRKAK